ncbi:MAG: hypothetical protein S4CHLAM123_13650 [Chlamydiales bacterium]|nr:hypothetical protein [Chlamydiales bacterium]
MVRLNNLEASARAKATKLIDEKGYDAGEETTRILFGRKVKVKEYTKEETSKLKTAAHGALGALKAVTAPVVAPIAYGIAATTSLETSNVNDYFKSIATDFTTVKTSTKTEYTHAPVENEKIKTPPNQATLDEIERLRPNYLTNHHSEDAKDLKELRTYINKKNKLANLEKKLLNHLDRQADGLLDADTKWKYTESKHTLSDNASSPEEKQNAEKQLKTIQDEFLETMANYDSMDIDAAGASIPEALKQEYSELKTELDDVDSQPVNYFQVKASEDLGNGKISENLTDYKQLVDHLEGKGEMPERYVAASLAPKTQQGAEDILNQGYIHGRPDTLRRHLELNGKTIKGQKFRLDPSTGHEWLLNGDTLVFLPHGEIKEAMLYNFYDAKTGLPIQNKGRRDRLIFDFCVTYDHIQSSRDKEAHALAKDFRANWGKDPSWIEKKFPGKDGLQRIQTVQAQLAAMNDDELQAYFKKLLDKGVMVLDSTNKELRFYSELDMNGDVKLNKGGRVVELPEEVKRSIREHHQTPEGNKGPPDLSGKEATQTPSAVPPPQDENDEDDEISLN